MDNKAKERKVYCHRCGREISEIEQFGFPRVYCWQCFNGASWAEEEREPQPQRQGEKQQKQLFA